MSTEEKSGFVATYFSKEVVMRIAQYAEIASWVVLGVYAFDLALSMGVYVLQMTRGLIGPMGPSDVLVNAVYLIERPFRGVAYFFALQAVGHILLILLDIEDNTRRGARRTSGS
jgi:hypothetical protein